MTLFKLLNVIFYFHYLQSTLNNDSFKYQPSAFYYFKIYAVIKKFIVLIGYL